jgi:divalent metal cation (Fe/Co/Zn/Cd) transporter
LLDTPVGLAVAVLILKSGIELAIKTARRMRRGDGEYGIE